MVDPLSYFSFQPVLHDWCNKGHGMCYHVCGMVHIKFPLLLIKKSRNLLYMLVRWVIRLILHGGPLSYFSFQPVLHDWCNKGHGMCYPVCGMVHIKFPLLLIKKSRNLLYMLMWWVVRSILHGGLIELFLAPASAQRLVWQRPWYVLSCLWANGYNQKE